MNPIEVWERIGFTRGKAVTWQKSFDRGRTWEDVNWIGGEIPFVMFTWDGTDAVEIERHEWRSQADGHHS